jgi:hypothetical protein
MRHHAGIITDCGRFAAGSFLTMLLLLIRTGRKIGPVFRLCVFLLVCEVVQAVLPTRTGMVDFFTGTAGPVSAVYCCLILVYFFPLLPSTAEASCRKSL